MAVSHCLDCHATLLSPPPLACERWQFSGFGFTPVLSGGVKQKPGPYVFARHSAINMALLLNNELCNKLGFVFTLNRVSFFRFGP